MHHTSRYREQTSFPDQLKRAWFSCQKGLFRSVGIWLKQNQVVKFMAILIQGWHKPGQGKVMEFHFQSRKIRIEEKSGENWINFTRLTKCSWRLEETFGVIAISTIYFLNEEGKFVEKQRHCKVDFVTQLTPTLPPWSSYSQLNLKQCDAYELSSASERRIYSYYLLICHKIK